MPKRKFKVRSNHPHGQGPEILRVLANVLEEGSMEMPEAELDLTKFRKIRVVLENTEQGLEAKVTVKFPRGMDAVIPKQESEPVDWEEVAEEDESVSGEADESGEIIEEHDDVAHIAADETDVPAPETSRQEQGAVSAPRKNYKKLKQRLDGPWKMLLRQVGRKGLLPDSADLEEFFEGCRAMVTYQGKGDPYYEAFGKQMEFLVATLEKGSVVEAQGALKELQQMKKRCHARFK